MIRSVLLFLLVCLNVTAQEPQYSWWLNFTNEPTQKAFGQVKAKDLNDSFSYISVFTCNDQSQFTVQQCNEIKQSGSRLNIKGDFNNDGVVEHWYTGVAKSNSQYFKILFAIDANGKLLHSLSEPTSKPGFSIFYTRDLQLAWVMCLYCGYFANVDWVHNQWLLNWRKDYG